MHHVWIATVVPSLLVKNIDSLSILIVSFNAPVVHTKRRHLNNASRQTRDELLSEVVSPSSFIFAIISSTVSDASMSNRRPVPEMKNEIGQVSSHPSRLDEMESMA